MHPEDLLQWIRSRPFVPLRLHLTNGETFDIRHPELAIVSRSRVDIGLDPDPKSGVVERTAHLGVAHIVRVEPLTAAAKPSRSNGEDQS